MDYYNYLLALPYASSSIAYWSSMLVTKVSCIANTTPSTLNLRLLSEKVFKTQTKIYVSYSFVFIFLKSQFFFTRSFSN